MTVSRRNWLLGGAGAVAAIVGAGLASRRLQAPAALDDAETALWALALETPTGDRLALKRFLGKPLVLNFWATWCPPCIEELPLLDGFYQQQAANGWQVLGLAVDKASAVRQFLARAPVQFPVAMAGLDGLELGRSLGNTGGGLPFTVVLGPSGGVLQRKIGKLQGEDLARWLTLR